MELLKKTIKQALTTGTTESCTGHCHVIIPDPNAVYHLTFLLSSEKHDFGFFDAYLGDVEPAPPVSTDTQFTDYDGDVFVDYDNSIFIE